MWQSSQDPKNDWLNVRCFIDLILSHDACAYIYSLFAWCLRVSVCVKVRLLKNSTQRCETHPNQILHPVKRRRRPAHSTG